MPKKQTEQSTFEAVKQDLKIIAEAGERIAKVARDEANREIANLKACGKGQSKRVIVGGRKLLMKIDHSMERLYNAIEDTVTTQKPPRSKKQRIKVQ